MVKNARTPTAAVLLACAAALACLAGCNLGVGIFPERLKSYEAYADLAGRVDPDRLKDYNFQIIRDSAPSRGNLEYLVLASDNQYLDGDLVIVYDADLNLLGSFSWDELLAMDEPNPFHGRFAMVDANGGIVVGNRRFTIQRGRLVYAATPPVGLHSPSVALLATETAQPNYANIWTRSDSSVFFEYQTFAADWSASTNRSDIFKGGMFGSKLFNVWLLDNFLAAIVELDGSRNLYLIDRVALAAPPLPIVHDNYFAGPVFAAPDVWWETLGFTDEGFAAFFDDPLRRYVRFDTWGNWLGESPQFDYDVQPKDQWHLYGRTSGWYVLDMKEQTLERRAWWWK